jgi:hypothetical protein
MSTTSLRLAGTATLSRTTLALVLLGAGACKPQEEPPNLDALLGGLTAAQRTDYQGTTDGGLAHITYWAIKSGSADFMSLPKLEQSKVTKMQANLLHSAKLQPTALIAGTEINGTLTVSDAKGSRQQEVVLKFPQNWNGSLVVAGTPAARNEYANEALIVPWVLSHGYAYVVGNKGMTNGGADGNTTLLGKKHITSQWGQMMLDLASWASGRLQAATGRAPQRVYAVGLSNGGYQVRRALEIDHQQVRAGSPRQFDGGIEWAGVYWPDSRVLDQNHDGSVSTAEYAGAVQLVSSMERAALTMGYAYDMGTLATPAAYAQNPMFQSAQAPMQAAGFASPSAVLWGAYTRLFDALKATLPAWKGIGYYNLTAYYYRADLLGDDDKSSAPYSIWALPSGDHPPFYDYPAKVTDAGWTADAVKWALANATTGEFSAPLISLHGDRDALIGYLGNGVAYDNAVKAYGTADLHRLYTIQNGTHVDAHADGSIDYDCDGVGGNEGAGDLLTPMQPYVERALGYLEDWVEHNTPPVASKLVTTDPKNDQLDATKITF